MNCVQLREGALDFVHGNVIAKYRVRLLEGRVGEPDEGRMRQGIAQVAGEAVGQAIHESLGAILTPHI